MQDSDDYRSLQRQYELQALQLEGERREVARLNQLVEASRAEVLLVNREAEKTARTVALQTIW